MVLKNPEEFGTYKGYGENLAFGYRLLKPETEAIPVMAYCRSVIDYFLEFLGKFTIICVRLWITLAAS